MKVKGIIVYKGLQKINYVKPKYLPIIYNLLYLNFQYS